MKNITLSADEDLIEQARPVALSQRKTLNAAPAYPSPSSPVQPSAEGGTRRGNIANLLPPSCLPGIEHEIE